MAKSQFFQNLISYKNEIGLHKGEEIIESLKEFKRKDKKKVNDKKVNN